MHLSLQANWVNIVRDSEQAMNQHLIPCDYLQRGRAKLCHVKESW